MQFQELLPYLLVIGVLSLMVAPVMWMQPSPRERRLASLRQLAISQGLQPQLRPVPAELASGYQGQIMTYGLQRTVRERNPGPRRAWHKLNSSWQGSVPVPPALTALPPDAMLVELVDNVARIYWLEGGDIEAIKLIKHVLQLLLDERN